MARISGLSLASIGVILILFEAFMGKVFLSTIFVSIVLFLFGISIFVRNFPIKFPKEKNGIKRSKLIEDIPLEITKELDHTAEIQQLAASMKKGDEVFFKLVKLNNNEDNIKVTDSNNKTLGLIPYTYPNRKTIANCIEEKTDIIGKIFKITKNPFGNHKIYVCISIYEQKNIVLKINRSTKS